jgi:hypothetical protein
VSSNPKAERVGLPLTHEHAVDIETRLGKLRGPLAERALSDATFCNLHLFRDVHAYRYVAGRWPSIAGYTYDGTAIIIPLFDIAEAPSEVLRELQGPNAWFFPVADEALAGLNPADLECWTVRDDADYLYAAPAFIDYAGPGLGPKRHAIARLLATTNVLVDPLGRDNQDAALAVLDGWCADKGRDPADADSPACREALSELVRGGPLSGFLHLADGVPAGFVIVEALNPGVLAVRFAKGRKQFDGIFAYLFQDLVRRCGPGLRWLNFEQDLGNPNFRRTKQSFRPAALLSKHRVRIRAG